jgi:hypothetical protein
MPGVKALRKIELGLETTAGTAVAGSVVWRGTGTAQNLQEVVFVDEDVGLLPQVDRTYVPRLGVEVTLDETPATFEQIGYILEAGVKAVTDSPVTDTGGSGYIYTYTFPTTTANTLNTYTIEYGDDQEQYETEYAHCTEFTISGAAGEAVMMGATFVGRQETECDFTGTALAAVEEILFQKGKLYIDTAAGTLGSTQVTSTFLGFSLTCTTGVVGFFTGDGNLYFTATKTVRPELVCDITFEHDDTGEAQYEAWGAETAEQIRILITGAALTTAGATYTYKTLQIDMAGKWENFPGLEDQDGNNVRTGTFRASYDSTAALFAVITVVNELSSLP